MRYCSVFTSFAIIGLSVLGCGGAAKKPRLSTTDIDPSTKSAVTPFSGTGADLGVQPLGVGYTASDGASSGTEIGLECGSIYTRK